MFRTTTREDFLAETCSRVGIEDAFLLEHAESIGIQDLCPLVAVVPSGISSRHDVTETHAHATIVQGLQHHGLFPSLTFEGAYVLGKWSAEGVVCHIQQAEAYLTATCITALEVAALANALDKFLGHGFACLIVACESIQEFGLGGIVFHELGGEFYEVPVNVGARQSFVSHLREYGMQGMTELVQEGLHLAQGEQGGTFLGGFGEVHHYGHDGTHVLAGLVFNPLFAVCGHPGTGLLVGTGMEVGKKNGQERTVGILHAVCHHIGVVHRNVCGTFKGNAIQTCCQTEDTILYLLQLEVGTKHLAVYVVALHLQQITVVREVPGLKHEVLAFLLPGQLLYLCHLALCHRAVCFQQLVHKVGDVCHVLCHTALQHEVGIGLVPHYLCQLLAEVHKLAHVLEVVVLVVVRADGVHGTVHLLSEVTTLAVLHKGTIGRGLQGDYPTIHTTCLCLLTGSSNGTFWQTGEVLLCGQMHGPSIGVVKFVLREL